MLDIYSITYMQTEVYGSNNIFTHSKVVFLFHYESGVILLQFTTYTENLRDFHRPMARFTLRKFKDDHICAQVWSSFSVQLEPSLQSNEKAQRRHIPSMRNTGAMDSCKGDA